MHKSSIIFLKFWLFQNLKSPRALWSVKDEESRQNSSGGETNYQQCTAAICGESKWMRWMTGWIEWIVDGFRPVDWFRLMCGWSWDDVLKHDGGLDEMDGLVARWTEWIRLDCWIDPNEPEYFFIQLTISKRVSLKKREPVLRSSYFYHEIILSGFSQFPCASLIKFDVSTFSWWERHHLFVLQNQRKKLNTLSPCGLRGQDSFKLHRILNRP